MKNRNEPTRAARQGTPVKAMPIIRRRRQLHPFVFQMGPVALCITSVLLIGLMAVLYLSQLGQAVAANQKLQDIRTQQTTLSRQNQDLMDTLAREQSPGALAEQARQQGLVPADPQHVWVLPVKNLQPFSRHQLSDLP